MANAKYRTYVGGIDETLYEDKNAYRDLAAYIFQSEKIKRVYFPVLGLLSAKVGKNGAFEGKYRVENSYEGLSRLVIKANFKKGWAEITVKIKYDKNPRNAREYTKRVENVFPTPLDIDLLTRDNYGDEVSDNAGYLADLLAVIAENQIWGAWTLDDEEEVKEEAKEVENKEAEDKEEEATYPDFYSALLAEIEKGTYATN